MPKDQANLRGPCGTAAGRWPTTAGCAHGLTTEMLADLIRDGLANGRTEHLVIAGHTTEIMRVRITEAGRRMLAETP
jgi:hypothetical protein